jgi:hypothetical protein
MMIGNFISVIELDQSVGAPNFDSWHETEVRALRSVDPFSDGLQTSSRYRLMDRFFKVRRMLRPAVRKSAAGAAR